MYEKDFRQVLSIGVKQNMANNNIIERLYKNWSSCWGQSTKHTVYFTHIYKMHACMIFLSLPQSPVGLDGWSLFCAQGSLSCDDYFKMFQWCTWRCTFVLNKQWKIFDRLSIVDKSWRYFENLKLVHMQKKGAVHVEISYKMKASPKIRKFLRCFATVINSWSFRLSRNSCSDKKKVSRTKKLAKKYLKVSIITSTTRNLG